MSATPPTAFTPAQLRQQLYDHFKALARYWSEPRTKPIPGINTTERERMEGLVFSILVALDGGAMAVACSYDLVARPHPEDKAYRIEQGEQWAEDGMVINDSVSLHEEVSRGARD